MNAIKVTTAPKKKTPSPGRKASFKEAREVAAKQFPKTLAKLAGK